MATIRTAAGVRAKLHSVFDRDEAESIAAALLEKAMQDAVTSFQRLCERLYEDRTERPPARNAFQRLDAGSQLWMKEVGLGYEQLIDTKALGKLRTYFQQRHLLSHQQGIVDQEYIERSGDQDYAVGQRLVIRETNVREFADIVERLGQALIAQA